MSSSDAPFVETDSPEFQDLTAQYLVRGYHSSRGMTAVTYADTCRIAWQSIETDSLYCHKYIEDPLAEGQQGNPFGVSIATLDVTMDSTGTQWTPSIDYANLRRPLGPTRRELIFVHPPDYAPQEAAGPTTQNLLVALFDVLGFGDLFTTLGLEEIHRRELKRGRS